jgi:hypothetical protein
VLLFNNDGRSTVDDTPLTLEVNCPEATLKLFVVAEANAGVRSTDAPVTPFTVVVSDEPDSVLATVVLLFNKLGRSTVDETPLTFEVNCPEATLKLFVVAEANAGVRSTDAPVTPFTVVVSDEPDSVLATVVLLFNKLGRSTVDETPFTFEVNCPEATLNVLVVLLFNKDGRSTVDETPLTFEVNCPEATLKLFVVADDSAVLMSTGVLATPFTVVVRFLPLKALLTVVLLFNKLGRSTVDETPLTFEVN